MIYLSYFLSSLRKEQGMTQSDVAQIIGVSKGAIAMYETGKRTPKLANAIKLANYFNVPVEKIIFFNNENKE